MNTVDIDLDKTRHLRYTWGSVRRLKRECGLVFTELLDEQLSDLDVIASVLWAGLVWEDATLTVDSVADMVALNRTGEISNLIAEAIKASVEPTDPTVATV